MLAVAKCCSTRIRSSGATQRLPLIAFERRSKRVSKSFRLSDQQWCRLPSLSRHAADDETNARPPRGALTNVRRWTLAIAVGAGQTRKCPGLPAECARRHLRSRDSVHEPTQKHPQNKNRKLLRCDRWRADEPCSCPSRLRSN